jgi:hypothetical protein
MRSLEGRPANRQHGTQQPPQGELRLTLDMVLIRPEAGEATESTEAGEAGPGEATGPTLTATTKKFF